MRSRSSSRALRLVFAALVASTAPIALLPSLAQERVPLTFAKASPVVESTRPDPEVSRSLTIREFEDGPTPLESGFYDLPGMSTADILPERAILAYVGQNQAHPSGIGGTGNQNYFFGIETAVSDRIQLGVSWNKFADPVTIGGAENDLFWRSASVNGAFKFVDNGSLQVTGRASAAWLSYRSNFHGTRLGGNDTHFIGSFHLPMSVAVGNSAQLMLVPALSFFPDQINGVDMYGLIPSIGVGGTVHPTQRLGFFGLVNVPFGGNGNTFDAVTGAPRNVPVWSAGMRYMATPKAALDLYLTNGFGATPTMDILAFVPDGNELVYGVKLSYTPGWSRSYRPNYRGFRDAPITDREKHLQYRGLTLASADTLEAGTILFNAGYGTEGHRTAGVRFSPDHDLEFGYFVEWLSDDGSRPPNRKLGASDAGVENRWGIQGKVRVLDQNNGSPISMSANIEVGREFSSRFGVAFGSVPISYKFSPRIAVTAEPKAAFYTDQKLYGVGVGVNAELLRGLELIGEVTPMAGGDRMTWAAGARFHLDSLGWIPSSLDISASNAIGTRAAASMVAQDDVRYSIGVTVPLDGKGLFNSLF